MRIKFLILLQVLFHNFSPTINAKPVESIEVDIGDVAPELKVKEWLKGKPINTFEKGKVYVLDFWATWCGYCIVGMPHFSKLARQYKRKVTFLSINVWEKEGMSSQKIKQFVDSLGTMIRFRVAVDENEFMAKNWLDASESAGIPVSFVVDANGKIAWIGHPAELKKILPKILQPGWNLESALADRRVKIAVAELGGNVFQSALEFNSSKYMSDFFGEPDSAMALLSEALNKEPNLNYEPRVVGQVMHALLRKNFTQASQYARKVLDYDSKSIYTNFGYYGIISALIGYPYHYNTVPKYIFELGAEALQRKIDDHPWGIQKTSQNYFKLSEWYFMAGDGKSARKNMRKAVKALKREKK